MEKELSDFEMECGFAVYDDTAILAIGGTPELAIIEFNAIMKEHNFYKLVSANKNSFEPTDIVDFCFVYGAHSPTKKPAGAAACIRQITPWLENFIKAGGNKHRFTINSDGMLDIIDVNQISK